MAKQYHALDPTTPLRIVAVYKKTMETFEQFKDYHYWITLKKNYAYHYYAYQVN